MDVLPTRRGLPVAITFGDEVALPGLAELLLPLLDLLPAMVSVKDPVGRYRFMNAFEARLYGTTPEDALGRTDGDLMGDAFGAYTDASDARVLRDGRPIDAYEEEYADATGALHDWLTIKVPLRDAGNRCCAVGALSVEITTQKRAQRALEQGIATLDRANRSKTQFLAELAHEVRTPIHAVQGFAGLLQRQRFGALGDPRYLRFAEDIAQAAEHLRDLVEDMLDMSRTEVGRIELREEPVEVAALFDQAVRLVSLAIAGKSLLLQRPPPPPVRLRVDARRIVQVLANLLSNAAKFTPAGGTITLLAETLPDGRLALVVEDTGPGIAPEELEDALAPFSRLPGSAGVQGAGIGLPLAAGLVASHGGRLELGRGAGELGTRAAALLPAARVLA